MSNWTLTTNKQFPDKSGFYFVTLQDRATGHLYVRPAYFRHEEAWEDFKRPEIREWKIEGTSWGDIEIAWQPMSLPQPVALEAANG